MLALAAARAIASASSGMAMWGLVPQRFLPFALGWLPWIVLTAALIPSLGRRLAPSLAAAGEGIVNHPAIAAVLGAGLSVALVLSLPDRTLFLGDFAMRTGMVLTDKDPAVLFPQAMPLDVLTHVRLARWLVTTTGLSVQVVLRGLGAIGAAALAVAALRLPAAIGVRGAAALAATVATWAGGTLGMFTGYGKSAIEMTALTTLASVAALSAVGGARARGDRGLIVLGMASAIALGFHRAGLLLVPLALTAMLAAPGSALRPARLIGAALLVAGLAVFGPRAVQLVLTFDQRHHLAPLETRASGGMLGSLLDPLHLLDVLNVSLVLSPLAPVLLALGIGALGRRREPGAAPAPTDAVESADHSAFVMRRNAVLVALVLPALALLFLTRPQQGIFRDRDVFAQSGIALSVVTAVAVAGLLGASRARRWLCAAVVLGALVPTVQWLALMNRTEDALRYIRAYIAGPPERPAWDRAATWDFLGTRAMARQQWDVAGDSYQHAVEAAQSPRLIAQWGMTDLMRERQARAESLFDRAVTLDSNFTLGWSGLASAASWTGDLAQCRRAERALERLDPSSPQLVELRAFLARSGGEQAR
ncbi:MAG TPA: hypothetical protein VL123_03050 [Candidatus Udaeobacter sp.]|nr:hypothetical protein [Candidatus Udaeobacter sp.]